MAGSSGRVGVCTELYGICTEVAVSPKLPLNILPDTGAEPLTSQGRGKTSFVGGVK